MSLDIAELTGESERLSQDNNTEGFLENFVKMPENNGAVMLRLLSPAPKGMFGKEKNPFYVATRVHRVNNKSLHCPKVLKDGKWQGECSICKYYNWLWQESEKKSPAEAESLQKTARAIKPIERYYYNTIVRSVTNSNGEIQKNVGPKILSIGKTLHKMIIRGIVGDKEMDEKPLGDVTNPKTGRDFKLVKEMRQSGKESYPNYSASKFLDQSVLGDPAQIEKWTNELHDLQALRVLKSDDELRHELKVHLGLVVESSGGFDPTEFQSGSGSSSSAKAVVQNETKQKVESKSVESEDTNSVDEEIIADEDFMNELKAINNS